ncbi:MAG: calcium/proton exchanger, partial [Acidimicrobiales bacterium]
AERLTVGGAAAVTAAAAVVRYGFAPGVDRFVVSGLALAALAAVVGTAVEQVGERLGPSATGLLQSTLGNLPELFVGIFALRAGLVGVVRAALVGSVLASCLLVLGLAFMAGGFRHGRQKFDPTEPRLHASLLVLAVGALLVPTLAARLNTPAASHSTALSTACAIVLVVVYLASLPFFLRRYRGQEESGVEPPPCWPLRLSVLIAVLASLAAAFASDWFVSALVKATASLGISQTFTGLVVVALASNAVENAVGIRFALRPKPEFAIATTLSSPLQVALLLTPALVLLSGALGPHHLTLVFPSLMVAALATTVVAVVVVIYDGEYTWLEGVALVGLYVIIAAGFWWG